MWDYWEEKNQAKWRGTNIGNFDCYTCSSGYLVGVISGALPPILALSRLASLFR